MRAPSYNKVTLIGVVGSSRLDKFEDGRLCLNFSVGTERFVFDGERCKAKRDWHWLTIWGDRNCTRAGKEILKGVFVIVEGRIRYTNVVEDGKFVKRFTDIIVDFYRVIGGESDEVEPKPGRTLEIDPEMEDAGKSASMRYDEILRGREAKG